MTVLVHIDPCVEADKASVMLDEVDGVILAERDPLHRREVGAKCTKKGLPWAEALTSNRGMEGTKHRHRLGALYVCVY